MYGFYEWEARKYPQYAEDCERALDALNNCQYAYLNKRGDYNDATALDNVLPMEALLNECNQLRQQDDNFDRHTEVMPVNNTAMAVAQANTNYAAKAYTDTWAQYKDYSRARPHPSQFKQYQDLQFAAGKCPDPYEGWYRLEKLDYEGKPGGIGQTGHYYWLMHEFRSVTPMGLARCTNYDYVTYGMDILYWHYGFFRYLSDTPTPEFLESLAGMGRTYTEEQIMEMYLDCQQHWFSYLDSR